MRELKDREGPGTAGSSSVCPSLGGNTIDGESGSGQGANQDDVYNNCGDSRKAIGGLVKDEMDLLEDHQSPTYILMDEDDYESIVAQMKHSLFEMEMPMGSRVPSRPVTPCRQTKLKELLGQIDSKFNPENPAIPSSLLNGGVVRYRNLLEMIERSGCLAGCPPGDRDELLSAVLGQSSSSSSKWTSPGRIGQAELYDALERVLSDLRAFTPYCLPFCTKVSKKEVPDYFDVIKRPMDLGTMGRKLKAMLYNNKREFMADLQRIYNNCFTYNTDPNSLLRMHVTMLKEKWTKLMAEVPDIQIRVAATTQTGLSERSQSQMSIDSSTDAGGYTSEQHSMSSTRNPTASQIVVDPIIEVDSAHASRILSPSECTVDARSSLGMGFYHRSRTRPSTRPASHRHPSQFRPELACPNQVFPDGMMAPVQIRQPDPPPFDASRIDGLLANLEHWRRLWATRSAPLHASRSFDLEASQAEINVSLPRLAYEAPTFASADCKVARERETKRVLGLLLAHEGFQSVKADALTLLMDLFLDRFASLATALNISFTGNQRRKSALLLLRQSLQLDGSSARSLARYTGTFLALRRRCLERACEAVQEAQRELRAAAASMEEEVDVEAVDDQQDLLGEDDDLLDVDDEALLLGEDELPLPLTNDSDSPPSTINLAAISTTSVVTGSAISASDILLVPKRSLQIPLQQPPPKRPHQED